MRERVLGEEHPDSAASFNSVAFNLNAQGRYAESEPLFRKAHKVFDATVGRDQANTVGVAKNIGVNLDAQGR